MSILISSIGMLMLSIGLCEMGYGIKTTVWWLICIGISLYVAGWKLH